MVTGKGSCVSCSYSRPVPYTPKKAPGMREPAANLVDTGSGVDGISRLLTMIW
jgi:hypothetical protein